MKNLKNSNEKNIKNKINTTMKIISVMTIFLVPMLAFASVESSLAAVQTKLVGTVLPLAAMCGLVFAGFSFITGQPNARSHLVYAILGAVIGFGAESIVSLVRSLIH